MTNHNMANDRLHNTIHNNKFSLWLEDVDRVSEPVYQVLERSCKTNTCQSKSALESIN